MTQLAGTCYSVVSVGGAAQQGSILTRANSAHKRLHLYPSQTTGYSALVLKPGDMRDMPQLTWAGFLSASNKALVAGLCALLGSPDFSATLVPSIDLQTVVYGDTSIGAFSSGGCFGTRLRLIGRSNELIQFSLEMVGKTTAVGAVSAPPITDEEFFPFEKGTQDVGEDAVIGFDIEYRTGFFARFAPDGGVGYSGINESLRLRNLRAQLVLAQSAVAMGEYANYAGRAGVTHTLGLSGSAGTACVLALRGYYTDWQYRDVNGVMAAVATLTGVSDRGAMISMN